MTIPRTEWLVMDQHRSKSTVTGDSEPRRRPGRFHVIVVLQGPSPWLEACLAATQAQSLLPSQLTVFDDASGHPFLSQLPRVFPQVRLMQSPRSLGHAAANNRAVAASREADFILLLSPDSVLSETALERLADCFARYSHCAVLGPKVLAGDVETIQHVGVSMRGNGLPDMIGGGELDTGQYGGFRDVLSLQVAAMATRTEIWSELGGLDESFWPAYYEQADFCFRTRSAGWSVGVTGDATVTHFNNTVPYGLDRKGMQAFFLNRGRFLRKHYRPKDWLLRYLGEELRWLLIKESKGIRGLALASTCKALVQPRQVKPQHVTTHQ